jgi:hypothetical protein
VAMARRRRAALTGAPFAVAYRIGAVGSEAGGRAGAGQKEAAK